MAEIQVTVSGSHELARKLLTFTGGGINLKRSLGASGLYLTRFFSGEVFASRGRVIGRPWPALNPHYAVEKARKWPGRPPLVRTGEMMRSFKFKEAPKRLELWNSARYFLDHQEGRGHLPQRVMMRIDSERAARIVKYIVGDLTEQMQKEGLL